MSAFNQLIALLAAFFRAGELFGKSLVNIATYAEEGTGAFVDEKRVERTAKLAALNKEHGLTIEMTK